MKREDELIRALLDSGSVQRMPPPLDRYGMTPLERAVCWGLVGMSILAIWGAWL